MPAAFHIQDDCVFLDFGKWKDSALHEVDDWYLQWVVREHANGTGFQEDDDDHFVYLIEEELKHRGVSLTGED